MAEIFLGYILSFVDFVYKIAVIAFVAQQFGYISAPKLSTSEPQPSTGTETSSRSRRATQTPPNPLGDAFKGIMEQMGPMLSNVLKAQPKTAMNFSDEPTDEPVVSTESETLSPPAIVELSGN